MSRKQVITIELELKDGQHPYSIMEGTYAALLHFFEDIGYAVRAVASVTPDD